MNTAAEVEKALVSLLAACHLLLDKASWDGAPQALFSEYGVRDAIHDAVDTAEAALKQAEEATERRILCDDQQHTKKTQH